MPGVLRTLCRASAQKRLKGPDVVQPDLLIVGDLDEAETEDGWYMGTPALVVGILSSSTRRNDMVSKLNSYMLAGVQEYWIGLWKPIRVSRPSIW
ncbi:MAG: Uma2 family endonuclease [Bacillota bacterium]|nr:Uma2 family endonuclease [Bacillota bacterium]